MEVAISLPLLCMCSNVYRLIYTDWITEKLSLVQSQNARQLSECIQSLSFKIGKLMLKCHLEQLDPGKFHVEYLEDPHLQTCLKIFQDLVSSCRGPQGQLKIIRNSAGGHVTWTKISSRLFSSMSISRPVLKVILSSAQGHLNRFRDGGLFLTQFCLTLIDISVKLNIQRCLLTELYEKFVCVIESYVNSDACVCCFEIDIFSLDQIMCVISSLCEPKLSHLCIKARRHLYMLFLDVFLWTLPLLQQEFRSDRVFIQTFEEEDNCNSVVLKGLLIECSELSSVQEEKNNVRRTGDSQGVVKVKVVIILESMSGDLVSPVDAQYDSAVDMDRLAVNSFMSLCEEFVLNEVGLLLCQKVIHPKVKSLLRRSRVLFVDRLGTRPMAYLQDLTGAVPLSVTSTLQVSLTEESSFGWLDDVSHQIWSGKSYLFLENKEKPIVTLALKSYSEEELNDLKVLYMSTHETLMQLLKHPYILCGGGCWQAHVASYLLQQVKEKKSSLVDEFDCQESHILLAAETFSEALLSAAKTLVPGPKPSLLDPGTCHVWSSSVQDAGGSCNCGYTQRSKDMKVNFLTFQNLGVWNNLDKTPSSVRSGGFPKVMDALCVAVNAFKIAVATANTVMSISQFVQDIN